MEGRRPSRFLGLRTTRGPTTALVLTFAIFTAALLVGLSPPTLTAPSGRPPTPAANGPQATGLENTWTNLSPASAPPPRVAPAMTFDSKTGQLYLFGGWAGPYATSPLNDTWSYDPAANVWTNRSPATHPDLYMIPDSVAMVYDSQADRIILYGGCQASPACWPNQTWAYDPNANTWTRMQPASSPYAGQGFGLVYDSAADRVLLFGLGSFAPDCQCAQNITWVYDYTADSWSPRQPAVGPSGRFWVALAYSPRADRTLLFGGCISGMSCTQANDTWSYDYGADLWTDMSPASSPPPESGMPMVYDGVADRFILFGGGTNAPGNETWSYNFTTNAWVDQRPATSPPDRSWPKMAYDSVHAQTLLFGGAWPLFNDTWSYTYGGVTVTAPSAPRNLAARAGTTSNTQDQVTLTWQPPENNGGYAISGYRIYRGTASGAESLYVTLGLALSYVDTGVVTSTSYYYQVTAVNAAGEGPPSTEASATPLDLTVPTVVMNYPVDGATLPSASITVRGTASDDVAVQKVEISVNNGTWSLASGTTSWSMAITLPAGGNNITVRAMDPSGNVGLSGANVTVTAGSSGTGGIQGSSSLVWVGVGILVIAAAIVGAVAWMWTRRRGGAGPPP